MTMLRTILLSLVAASGLTAAPVSAAVVVVNGLGVNGWNSNDTRPPAGGPASPAQIAAQIVFMNQGQSVLDAAGAMPGAGPLGSLNGAGYVRLDGTNANPGKSDLSFVGNLGSASLLDSNFELSYRYYNDPNPTTRTVALNIEVKDTSNALNPSYNFAHIMPGNLADVWQTNSVDATTDLFFLYGHGAPNGLAGSAKTLTDWFIDGTFGAYLAGGDITRIGFNVGSSARNNLTYLDWVQTNLLNNGDLIDFQGPAPVPEPASLVVWSLLAAAGGVSSWRKRKRKQLLKQA